MAIDKILCPTDFSSSAAFAQRVAARIAVRDHADIVLAHVWDPGDYGLRGDPEALVEECRGRLATEARAIAEITQRSVTPELAVGAPWRELVAIAERERVDLVVAGTHGRGAIARVLLGTVATQLVRHAPSPVLVTREHERVPAFRRLLVPTDFSEHAREAIELATHFVEPGGAITLLHVIEMPLTYTGTPTEIGEQLLERRAHRTLADLADELRHRVGVPVTTALRFGPTGAEILDALAGDAFDLVVLGSHGRTGLRRALLGSVAEKVVRHAPCAVLVARAAPTS